MATQNQPRRILVVDDDAGILALLKLHLSNAGYDVAVAEDAVVAGRLLLESPPDLLIVDVDMPYMTGIEFVATVIADSTIPHFPFLFITAHEDFVENARALDAECLTKPFVVDALLAAVARSLVPAPRPA